MINSCEKIKLQTLGFLLLCILVSCDDSFLDKKPLGQLTSDNFFKTEEHAVWATNAIYNHLRDWEVHVFSYIGMTDIVSDDSDKGSTASDANFLRELDEFSFDAGNIACDAVWQGYYKGIYRANLVIANLPAIDMDENLKVRLIGEAKFLRAYFYFNLVRWFGDLPLITAPLSQDEYKQSRVSQDAVYEQIIADLEAAIAQLPTKAEYASADLGRATQGAAMGLLAKVYLTRGNYELAAQFSLSLIQRASYSLFPNYVKLFSEEGENASESLFEVQTTALETGGGGSQYNEVQGVRGVPNLGWGFNRPSDDLVEAYEFNDPRREATILYVGELLPDGSEVVQDNPNIFNERYNQKAWVPRHAGGNGNGNGNIRILRYADVLLIAAEALNELNRMDEALIFINLVRERARGGNPFALPAISSTDTDELRTLIWKERRVELAMEQGRWFDLVRQNRVSSVMQALGKNFVVGKHELFPIPQSEIDLSGGNLVQNPGWN